MTGKIPQGWKISKIGKICKVITGTTPPKSDTGNYGDKYPFFKPPHLWDGNISETEEMLSQQGAKYARIVPINTVLVTCIGNLGRTGFLKTDAAFNQQINAILENDSISGRYLFYIAQSPLFRSQLERLATGTTVSIVNKSNFETIEIPVPPPTTQQAIVYKIEELFSEIDKGVETLKTAQKQLRVYRQSVLKWAFEGKLTTKNVEGKFPERWKLLELHKLCEVITDGDHQAPPKVSSGIPFITISNVDKAKNSIDFTSTFFVSKEYFENIKSHRKPLIGDVLYTVTGSFGIPVLVNFDKAFCFQRHIALIKPLESIDHKWLFYLMMSPNVYKQAQETATGTAQKTVALTSLRNFKVPYCSIDEQRRIVEEIEGGLSVADNMNETITQSLLQAETLKQSILKKAFEGKLVQ